MKKISFITVKTMKGFLGILLIGFCVLLCDTAMGAPGGGGGGGTSKVTVENTIDHPVPVTVQNQPDVRLVDVTEPVQASTNCTVSEGKSGCDGDTAVIIYNVPSGKRLEIEYFSCSSLLYQGQELMCLILTKVGGGYAGHYLPITPRVSETGQNYISAGQTVKLYADPDSQVMVMSRRNGWVGSASVLFSISGRLVDLQ